MDPDELELELELELFEDESLDGELVEVVDAGVLELESDEPEPDEPEPESDELDLLRESVR